MEDASGKRPVVAHPLALHRAAANGWLDQLRSELAAGSVHTMDEAGEQALHHAVRHGHLACVELLVARGADVDAPSRGPTGQLNTPLHTAVKASASRPLADFLGIVRALLDAGADPGRANRAALSPFHVAVTAGAVEICKAMLAASPELHATLLREPDAGGAAPVHMAAARGDGLMLQLLLAQGADPKARNARGQTPADVATASGHSQVGARGGAILLRGV